MIFLKKEIVFTISYYDKGELGNSEHCPINWTEKGCPINWTKVEKLTTTIRDKMIRINEKYAIKEYFYDDWTRTWYVLCEKQNAIFAINTDGKKRRIYK